MRHHRAAIAGAALLASCTTPSFEFDRPYVSGQLRERTGYSVADGSRDLPPAVDLEDGVSEDEAVAIALWRNAAFEEVLTELGFRRADLAQAGLLPNPVLSLLFPLGPKQLEFAVKMPLEALWLRPSRVAIAEADAERAAALLVESGLDLVRDVRQAFSEWEYASQRVELTARSSEIRERLDELARARLRNGDASEGETAASSVDWISARSEASRACITRDLARDRLRLLIGFARDSAPLEFEQDRRASEVLESDVAALLEEALVARPEVRAAEMGIKIAGERAGLARSEFLAIAGILDANAEGTEGFEWGPGIELPIPLFDRGGSARTRAEADVERVARHYLAVRDRLAHEVREAHAQYLRSIESRRELERAIPLVEGALDLARRAEQAGETLMLPVWEGELRVAEFRTRDAEVEAECRRARAQLERAMGRKLE